MPRARLAIAHFVSAESAADVRRDLIAQGARVQLSSERDGPLGAYRLEVFLPATDERRFLNVLLSSDASRVYIHDAD